MNNFKVLLLALIVFAGGLTNLQAENVFFTGNGDGTTWEDPQNWNNGAVPTADDFVGIDGSFDVEITQNGAEALFVEVADDGSLTVNAGASLLVDRQNLPNEEDEGDEGDGIVIKNNGQLTNNGVLIVKNADDDGIDLRDNGILVNNAGLSITTCEFEGIDLGEDSSLENNGTIQIQDIFDGDGLDINNQSSIVNNGQIQMLDIENEGSNLDNSGSLINYGLYSVDGIDGNDGICIDDPNAVFDNYGEIEIMNVINTGEGIEVDDGVFYNRSTGVINISDVNGDLLNIESGGEFFNEGLINAEGNDATVILELEQDGFFENSGIVNLSDIGEVALDTFSATTTAIQLEGDGSTLENLECGVINILTQHEIELEVAGATITNDGVIATVFSGTNTNEGTFTNNGKIVAPNGFDIAPNALEGAGVVDLQGAVPAHSLCFSIGSINCEGSAEQDPENETVVQIAEGCVANAPYTADALSFALTELCGDGEIVARVASIDGLGFGGITMRETKDAGSKKVQLNQNLTTSIRREVRFATNGSAFPQHIFSRQTPWMKITRSGNIFTAFVSRDGQVWRRILTTTIVMDDCIKVGVVTSNFNVAAPTTVSYDNVRVTPAAAALSVANTTPNVISTGEKANGVDIEIYPNPSTGLVNVTLPAELDQEVQLHVYNAVGQFVKQVSLNAKDQVQSDIDLSALNGGVYYLRFLNETGQIGVERLILNK